NPSSAATRPSRAISQRADGAASPLSSDRAVITASASSSGTPSRSMRSFSERIRLSTAPGGSPCAPSVYTVLHARGSVSASRISRPVTSTELIVVLLALVGDFGPASLEGLLHVRGVGVIGKRFCLPERLGVRSAVSLHHPAGLLLELVVQV